MELSDKVRDPVCGMSVDRHQYEVRYGHRHFAFCSLQCKRRFLDHPHLYLGYPGQPAPRQKGEQVLKRRRLTLDHPLSAAGAVIVEDLLRGLMGVRDIPWPGSASSWATTCCRWAWPKSRRLWSKPASAWGASGLSACAAAGFTPTKRRNLRPVKPRPPTTTSPESALAECACAPALAAGEHPFRLYTEGDELIEAMLAAIGGARRTVYLETYIFAADAVGRRFVAALAARAAAGVEVRLVVDALGSFLLFPRKVEGELKRAGVVVRRFHRWSWRQPWHYNRRDHRKLLVVDGRTAFLGGFNIHRQSSRRACGERRWRDSHVRLDGALAAQAAALFEAFWEGDRSAPPADMPENGSVLLSNHSRTCRRRLHCLLLSLFAGADASLFLTTPYFVPDHRLREGLKNAARRGVDVRLLVPRISDVRLARWAAQAVYGELLEAGVQVFEYLPRLLHAKTVVADGDFALLGTANLDYRSLRLNYELVLASRDPALCAALRQQFDNDLGEAEAVRLEHWRRRRWPQRLAGTLAWAVRRWL